MLNYATTTEFYNNLGNFNVEITAPNEYIVWATGTLENSAKVLPKDIYDKYYKARSSKEVIHIVSINDIEKGFKTLNNTWHYTATEVSDFAIALSDHYLWDAAMQPVADRQVFISSAHSINTIKDFPNLTAIQQKAMQHLSEDIPGIPYPYEAFTTFINNFTSGMEYPMMANNYGAGQNVTIHEMFHTYFPMYVRTNERRWAWMDEGWADYNTALVRKRFFENDYEITSAISSLYSNEHTMGTIADIPMITSSEFLTSANYVYVSYRQPATVYAIIHNYLGEELFLKCYREYINRWAKKSPSPYDFFYTFENVSGQDLGWLWKPWFFEFGVADVAIKSFEKDRLIITKKGNKPVPVFAEIKYKNGESRFIVQNAKIWSDDKNDIQITVPNYENVKMISVNMVVFDANTIDNFYPSIFSLYEDFDISVALLGQYNAEGYSDNISISKKDGLMHINIADRGISKIIYPKDRVHFSSLDGSINIKFNMEDSVLCKSIDFESRGTIRNGKKLE